MLSRLIVPTALARSKIPKILIRNQIVRQLYKAPREPGLIDKIFTAAERNGFTVGKGALGGVSVLGLGALCYYGLGLSSDANTILNNSMVWPQYVRDRVHDTYLYFGSSVAITAASAAAVFRTPALLNMFARTGWVSMIATFVLINISGGITRSIPYEAGFGAKQLAWVSNCTIAGVILAPLSLLGGQIIIRAAWYMAGIIGGLSTVAVCAPNDRFMYMGGPLAIGFGVVLASSFGKMFFKFLPASTALGAGFYSMSLLLFSASVLYDTQKIIQEAQSYPNDAVQKFDPINAAISIYKDIFNACIFIPFVVNLFNAF